MRNRIWLSLTPVPFEPDQTGWIPVVDIIMDGVKSDRIFSPSDPTQQQLLTFAGNPDYLEISLQQVQVTAAPVDLSTYPDYVVLRVADGYASTNPYDPPSFQRFREAPPYVYTPGASFYSQRSKIMRPMVAAQVVAPTFAAAASEPWRVRPTGRLVRVAIQPAPPYPPPGTSIQYEVEIWAITEGANNG